VFFRFLFSISPQSYMLPGSAQRSSLPLPDTLHVLPSSPQYTRNVILSPPFPLFSLPASFLCGQLIARPSSHFLPLHPLPSVFCVFFCLFFGVFSYFSFEYAFLFICHPPFACRRKLYPPLSTNLPRISVIFLFCFLFLGFPLVFVLWLWGGGGPPRPRGIL